MLLLLLRRGAYTAAEGVGDADGSARKSIVGSMIASNPESIASIQRGNGRMPMPMRCVWRHLACWSSANAQQMH